jgi:hypothetical protein
MKKDEMTVEEATKESIRRWNWLMGEIDCKPFIHDEDYDNATKGKELGGEKDGGKPLQMD